jgi:hypothetical protein
MSGFDLVVDARVHADELARFWAKVVRGPGAACWVWTSAIGDDGYGSFAVRRPVLDALGRPARAPASGRVLMREHVVSAPRYALAAMLGTPLAAGVVAEHAVCDEPICVRAHAAVVDGGLSHVVASTQALNLSTMGRRGRGGGMARWSVTRGPGRAAMAARSRAIRNVVREHGFDPARISAAIAQLAEESGQLPLF